MKPEITKKMLSNESLELIIAEISPMLDSLPGDMTVMAENLYLRDDWKAMSPYLRRMVGQQLAILVANGKIGLRFAENNNEAVQRYIAI